MRKSNQKSEGEDQDPYTPLLNDTGEADNSILEEDVSKSRIFRVNPFENSWLISKLFFSWVTPLARVRQPFLTINKITHFFT